MPMLIFFPVNRSNKALVQH